MSSRDVSSVFWFDFQQGKQTIYVKIYLIAIHFTIYLSVWYLVRVLTSYFETSEQSILSASQSGDCGFYPWFKTRAKFIYTEINGHDNNTCWRTPTLTKMRRICGKCCLWRKITHIYRMFHTKRQTIYSKTCKLNNQIFSLINSY